MSDYNFVKQLPDGISVKIKVQPRASANAIAGIVGDSLKICVTSPPLDGEANTACIAFLADIADVSKSKVELLSGHKNRNKIVKIGGITKERFHSVLENYLM